MSFPIFSEDFYKQSLFSNGERAVLNSDGTIGVHSRETFFKRFKRFITFKQDAHIGEVHDRLKVIMEQIQQESGPLFSSLINEVHSQGEKGFKQLEKNVIALRYKLDRIGQVNLFSSAILKIINVVRFVFHKPLIVLNSYAKDVYERPEVWWAANYSYLLNLSKYRESSFICLFTNLEKNGLMLTEKDKQSCLFRVDSLDPQLSEKFQAVEKKLKSHLLLSQTHNNFNFPKKVTKQILTDLSIFFDPQYSKFSVKLYNPRGSDSIVKELKEHAKNVFFEDNSVAYFVKYVDSGKAYNQELRIIFLEAEPVSFTFKPDIAYEICDEAQRVITSFTIKKSAIADS